MYHTRNPVTFLRVFSFCFRCVQKCVVLLFCLVMFLEFRHTFRRYLTNQHFGNCSCPHLVYHMEMVERQQPVWLECQLGEFVEVAVEHELLVVVLLMSMLQQYVDGLLRLMQLPSELDMVHIFRKKKKIFNFGHVDKIVIFF